MLQASYGVGPPAPDAARRGVLQRWTRASDDGRKVSLRSFSSETELTAECVQPHG